MQCPQLNFDIFSMDEYQNPLFQSPTSWTQISRALLSEDNIGIQQQKALRPRRKPARIQKSLTFTVANIIIGKTRPRRKSAQGQLFGFTTNKMKTIDTLFPRTFINQNLITQIRGLRILKQNPTFPTKENNRRHSLKKQKQRRYLSATKPRPPLYRLHRAKSVQLRSAPQEDKPIIIISDITSLDTRLILKINALVQMNRRISVRNIFKQKTDVICNAKFWNKIVKKKKSQVGKPLIDLLAPPPLHHSISNGSNQGFKTPNLVQNSLFSTLYQLEDVKQKYLSNRYENVYDVREESQQSPMAKPNAFGRDFIKNNMRFPQLQKILGCHQQLKKYIGSKSPTQETLVVSQCGKKQTVNQMLKKHVKQQQSLTVIKSQDRILHTKGSSYTECSSQIKSLIKRQKQRKVFILK